MGGVVGKLPWYQQLFNSFWDPIQAVSAGQYSSVPGISPGSVETPAMREDKLKMEAGVTSYNDYQSGVDAQVKIDEATKAAADKVAADKAASDKVAADAAANLAFRRRASSIFTSGSQRGVLGTAPVKLKTLLGQ